MKLVPLSVALAASLLAAPALHAADAKAAKPAPKESGKTAPKEKAKPEAPAPGTAPAAAAPAGVPAPDAAAAKKIELPESVATVEGKDIKREELEEAFNTMAERQGVPAEAIPMDQRGKIYHMLLDNLIASRLIDKRAADVQVKDEEVAATFDRLKTKFGSDEDLKKQVEANGQTIEGLKENIRTSLRQQHWVDSQIKDTPAVSDADAEKFYKQNPDQFKQPEQVRASHILIKVPEDAKPEVVVEKEKAAQAALKRVKGGEDFAKVAGEISDDPGSKVKGGDLDFFSKEQMVPEFAEAAFALKKNEISEPVRSEFGYHIIKLTDRKGGEAMPLAEVKPQLLAYLQRQKKQEEVTKVLEAVRASADVKVNLP